MDRPYVIVSNRHPRWPRDGLLFWGRLTKDDEQRSFGGYTTRYDQCEKYTREELVKWRGNAREHYPFFDEINPGSRRAFEQHDEVLCTLEDLKSLQYDLWTIVAAQ